MQQGAINFTKTTLQNLTCPADKTRVFFRDSQVKGLTFVIQKSGSKSFYLTKKIAGKSEQIFLGKHPDLSVENARKKAHTILAQIAMGINPQDQKRKYKQEMTLGELFEQYLERHSKVHKKSWKYDEREIPLYLKTWFHRKLVDIKQAEVRLLVEKIFAKNGLYQANRVLERIRAMYNKVIEWGWEGNNPTIGIKKYRERKRDRFVLPNELPYFFRALDEEENDTARDFFWILTLTGARKTNTLMMRWEEIMWELSQWRIPDTKNNEPLVVVLSPRAMSILKARHANSNSVWVFPQEEDNEKHFVNHKRALMRIKEKATIYAWLDDPKISAWLKPIVDCLPTYYNSGTGYDKIVESAIVENVTLPPTMIDIRLHDIRRTLASYQAINGTSLQIIGKSLGHKSLQATTIYARLSLEPVKNAVESATDTMFKFATIHTEVRDNHTVV